MAVEADAPPSREQLGAGATTWASVSLADKIDTLVGSYAAEERPTGTRDPYGLRRQAHGVLRILVDLPELTGLGARPTIGLLLDAAAAGYSGVALEGDARAALLVFLGERLGYLLEQRGYDPRNVRAVMQAQPVDAMSPLVVRRMLEALPEFTGTPEFTQLATAFKRVKNIARELPDAEFERVEREEPQLADLLREPAEVALAGELDRRRPVIQSLLADGANYRRALAEAAGFGPAVDRFFTDVFVMVDDQALRRARLRLMKRLERLILSLADISEIVLQTES